NPRSRGRGPRGAGGDSGSPPGVGVQPWPPRAGGAAAAQGAAQAAEEAEPGAGGAAAAPPAAPGGPAPAPGAQCGGGGGLRGLLQLREEQQRAERGCQREHLRQAQQRLREVALEVQAAQLKLLRQTSEREKKELQKILERRRHSSISEARGRGGAGGRRTGGHGEGRELTEISRRHISESVTSIRRYQVPPL
ncbi:1-phosphatidylinositol 4,5-bisphosphate phosphodiesterase beta-3-like, partial [Anser cygnoides]|uniref:1-phosphatidylinositol 4,5-bisphosphate phosphodiesterase beta-3-like n=1 Tax=Anser cygnoides TaxID=8845 RepID=UPI0034D2EB60